MKKPESFKLLKLPERELNKERMRLILRSFSNNQATDEWFAIDEVLTALEDHINTIDSPYSDSAEIKIIELRALIEKIYEPYF